MKMRVIAAAVLLPLLLVIVLVLPKVWTAVLFGLMTMIGAYELLYGTGLVKHPRLLAYAALMGMFIALWSGLALEMVWLMVAFLAFFLLISGEILISHAKLPYEKAAITFMAGVVIPMLLTAPVRLHAYDHGRFFILIPFVLAFMPDTGAYFAGRAFGKHKLAPIISPNKTVEGVIGGVLSAIIGMMIYCLVLQLAFDFQVNYLYGVIYGVLGALGAVFGDLGFSAVKRQVGIKDYGNLIPGHGGILDRFDSMTVVAPLTEVLMLLIPVAVK